MRAAAAAEYESIVAAAQAAPPGRRSLARLRRALRAVRGRDHFGAPERKAAERAVEELEEVAR